MTEQSREPIYLDWVAPSELEDDLSGEELEEHIRKLMKEQIDGA